jgi:hypothetical protein
LQMRLNINQRKKGGIYGQINMAWITLFRSKKLEEVY